ncbi:MAG: hypothetical protein AVDCRST_MAG23-622 [uncultured Sphingosinicella sp.]|uniref:Histidine kinase/HSP90-like ATPase domain-containing protein n=1 Tax=uncultured Sphingosinicella sp. TaxID=478748 RepID=A0A6J4TLP1_9SPHN|nr:ATP-binding protein [uncultured Sphingosinicella sp.]CAA9526661.1 MAG: hypothetical protein AVDCRST_MAG23-622 [uncultured Sphingosinicella sp.]
MRSRTFAGFEKLGGGLNLLSNAAKFTFKGTITLTIMRRQGRTGDRIMIEVRDTGIGISTSPASSTRAGGCSS